MKRFFTMSEWQGSVFYSPLGIYIIGGIFFGTQRFFFLELLFKWAKLAKFIRFEAMWKLSLFFITKFTEMWWNDSVFEGSEEHRRCSGKVTDIRLAGVEKLFPLWRDSSLRCASFRMTGLCFLLTIRNLIIGGIFFESQRFFFLNCFFKWAKWEFVGQLMKHVF